MSDTSSPNPSSAMLIFFILTSIYFTVKYNTDPKQNKIYFGIYVLLLIIGEFFINMSLTKALCGTNQVGSAIFITVIPWFFIFGLLNMMLMLFPGWLTPFSNTFGYGVARLFGINDLLNTIFKPKLSQGDIKDANVEIMAEALEHIYTDRSLLVNEISQNNFENFWTNMSSLFKPTVKNDGSLKKRLFNFIRLKDIVAEYIWFMLTGTLVTSVGYNYIVNKGCSQDVKEMQKRHKEYEEEEEKKIKESSTAAPKRVYSTLE
jgi:hypothetical protein